MRPGHDGVRVLEVRIRLGEHVTLVAPDQFLDLGYLFFVGVRLVEHSDRTVLERMDHVLVRDLLGIHAAVPRGRPVLSRARGVCRVRDRTVGVQGPGPALRSERVEMLEVMSGNRVGDAVAQEQEPNDQDDRSDRYDDADDPRTRLLLPASDHGLGLRLAPRLETLPPLLLGGRALFGLRCCLRGRRAPGSATRLSLLLLGRHEAQANAGQTFGIQTPNPYREPPWIAMHGERWSSLR